MILCCEVNTHFCRETGYVANTRFLAFFLLRFDSDKCDLTQTLLRYLVIKTLDWSLCFKLWHTLSDYWSQLGCKIRQWMQCNGWHQGHPWPVSAPPLRLPPLQVREGTAQCTVRSSIGLHNMLQHIRALVLDIAYMYIMQGWNSVHFSLKS